MARALMPSRLDLLRAPLDVDLDELELARGGDVGKLNIFFCSVSKSTAPYFMNQQTYSFPQ